MGRPSIRTPELEAVFLARIADGESLRSVCRDAAMPGTSAVTTWIQKDSTFAALYARARDEGEHRNVERMRDLLLETLDRARKGIATKEEIAHVRTMTSHAQWRASRLARGTYGDRVQVDAQVGVRVVEAPLPAKTPEDWAEKHRPLQ